MVLESQAKTVEIDAQKTTTNSLKEDKGILESDKKEACEQNDELKAAIVLSITEDLDLISNNIKTLKRLIAETDKQKADTTSLKSILDEQRKTYDIKLVTYQERLNSLGIDGDIKGTNEDFVDEEDNTEENMKLVDKK